MGQLEQKGKVFNNQKLTHCYELGLIVHLLLFLFVPELFT